MLSRPIGIGNSSSSMSERNSTAFLSGKGSFNSIVPSLGVSDVPNLKVFDEIDMMHSYKTASLYALACFSSMTIWVFEKSMKDLRKT